ncbi:FAD-binding-3 domain-containing protein [Mycena kentingensis (nom. inval.)]|nr:FAD-binding-3 domain-containing protein [Mycena kentingensis (nom. inval.)]
MPAQLTINLRKAACSLRILIVGGSIAGLACAFTLQRAGHKVTILERSSGKARSHGGLRSPPNMTRVLNHWGLDLSKIATKCTAFVFNEPGGAMMGLVQLHEEFLKDLMASFVFIQHGDLYDLLLGLATREGADIRYDCPVASVDCDTLTVMLATGERMSADLIVGADGPASMVRNAVVGQPITGSPDGHHSLTLSIPTELMRNDEELRPLCEDGNWWVWLGSSTLIHGSLVNSRKEFSIVIGLQGVSQATLDKYDESWDKQYPIEQFGIDFSTFDIRVQKLMKLGRQATPTVHIKRPILESCVCDRARVVIVGEAAHPLVPAGQHNTGLTIEDAETLGALFSRIQHPSQISRMLAAYEEIRQPRCNYAQDWELRKRKLITEPFGPEQKARDAGIRRMMLYNDWEHIDETRFREMWGDEMEMFSYFATERVDDWWTKWGSLLARNTGKPDVPLTPTVEVSISSGSPLSAVVY